MQLQAYSEPRKGIPSCRYRDTLFGVNTMGRVRGYSVGNRGLTYPITSITANDCCYSAAQLMIDIQFTIRAERLFHGYGYWYCSQMTAWFVLTAVSGVEVKFETQRN